MEITDETIVATLKAVVAERPEHRYVQPATAGREPGCLYVHGDVPGCLVGHVLHRMGVPLRELLRHEFSTASEVLEALDTDISERVGAFLDNVQGDQDSGATWGDALASYVADLEVAA